MIQFSYRFKIPLIVVKSFLCHLVDVIVYFLTHKHCIVVFLPNTNPCGKHLEILSFDIISIATKKKKSVLTASVQNRAYRLTWIG